MTALLADLSNNNRTVDLKKLAASRTLAGVLHKASQGIDFTDHYFAPRRAEAAKLGLRWGAYHYATPNARPTVAGAKQEAHHFCDVVGKLNRRDLRPALDYEVAANTDHLAWIAAFNRVVKTRLGVWPLFYSDQAFIVGLRLSRPVGDGLWLANFGVNDGTDHAFTVPAPWQQAVAHQFTSRGKLPGVVGDVDLTHAPKLLPLLAHPFIGRL